MKIGELLKELQSCRQEQVVWNKVLNYLNEYVSYDGTPPQVMVEDGVGTVDQEVLQAVVVTIAGHMDPLIERIKEIENTSVGGDDGKKSKPKAKPGGSGNGRPKVGRKSIISRGGSAGNRKDGGGSSS